MSREELPFEVIPKVCKFQVLHALHELIPSLELF